MQNELGLHEMAVIGSSFRGVASADHERPFQRSAPGGPPPVAMQSRLDAHEIVDTPEYLGVRRIDHTWPLQRSASV
jgi:hypothetical protein